MEEVNRVLSSPQRLVAELSSGRQEKAPNFSFLYPPGSKSLEREIERIARSWEIESEIEVGSRRRFFGWLVVFVKRLTRLSLAWYINPVVDQIRRFNMLLTRALFEISHALDDLQQRISELEAKVLEIYEPSADKESAQRPGGTEGWEE